jgi:glycosyltransferase involved in cell wall biosynthesis
MNDIVSIVLPSMNRPDRLVRCIQRILETTPYRPLEILVVIDVDTESRDRVLALNASPVMVLFNEVRRGAVACWNQGLSAATGDILCFFNDDCEPEPGWLEAALQAHQEQLGGYGLCGFSDGYQDGNILSVQYLFDRDFCIDHLGGVMAYPVYEFAWNDTESNSRAKRAGHFYWCQESVVQHRHWSRDGGQMDDLNRENMAMQGRDGYIYYERERQGFPDNFEPVIRRDDARSTL